MATLQAWMVNLVTVVTPRRDWVWGAGGTGMHYLPHHPLRSSSEQIVSMRGRLLKIKEQLGSQYTYATAGA